jgi:hypothetical protein
MGGPIDSQPVPVRGRTLTDAASGTSTARNFNLLTVRVLYALHDVPMENGPLCVVPAATGEFHSHTATIHSRNQA